MSPAATIQSVSKTLDAAKVENSLWQAKVLVAHVLKTTPSQLPLIADVLVKQNQKEQLSILVKKLLSGSPLQHVIGEWDFYGRTFKTDKRALIPRPETELLIEYILSAPLPDTPLILDVGTGSGIIGITLSLEIPNAVIIGTDISLEAIELADENKQLLKATNYSTKNTNLAHGINKKFDLVVANLPYIPTDVIPTLSPVVKDHDPVIALDGGTGGTLLILELINSLPKKLNSSGLVVLETGYDQEFSVSSLFKQEYWKDIQTHSDLAGNHRMVTARRR